MMLHCNTRHRGARIAGILLAGTVASVHGCDCDNDVVNPITYSCDVDGGRPGPEVTAPCGSDKRFALGRCLSPRCDPDGLCCPGLFCTGGGTCEMPPTYFRTCAADGECGDDQRCLLQPRVDPETPTCGYEPIVDGRCDSGQPWGGRCVETAPCGGACAPGQVCNIDLVTIDPNGMVQGGRCESPPPISSGCDQACGSAQLLVYADPDAMLFEQCCEVACQCLTLPSLLPGRWGRFSDVVLGPTDLFISAYDGTFGDLVMGTHGRLSGQLDDLDYIDGLGSGDVVADPAGPRGGIREEGPNVGTYTAIDLQDGLPRIVYYDIEAQDLKFAAYDSATGGWAVSLVDDGRDGAAANAGDVGRFTSLLIDASGIPHVTYYAHRTLVSGRLVTTPVYARGLSTSPGAYEDWERIPVDPVPDCTGTCTGAQRCIDEGGTPTCLPAREDCDPPCPCDEVCVEAGGQPVCRPELPVSLTEPCDGFCADSTICVEDTSGGSECLAKREGDCSPACGSGELCVDDGAGNPVCRVETPYSRIEGLPEGVGLFTSLAVYGNRATIVYYDRLRGQLRGAQASFDLNAPATDFATVVIACDSDDGRFASLAASPDGASIAVAYQGSGGRTLWYASAADFLSGLPAATPELVDDGVRSAQVSLVGASASLAFDESTGDALIAYQDQSTNDLLLAYNRGGTWQRVTLLQDGAYGSFARLAVNGGRAWVSNYQRLRDSKDRDASQLVVHIVDLSALP